MSDPGRTRPFPPARADGAPSVCLRCGERPPQESWGGALGIWCDPCFKGDVTFDDYAADDDAWEAHRAVPPPPDPRDDLLRRAVALFAGIIGGERGYRDRASAWLHDYAKMGGGR